MLRLRDLLLRNIQLYGDHSAVLFKDERLTWDDLGRRVFRLANRLNEVGISRQGRIAVMQTNGPEIVEVYFAASLLGAVVVPVSPRLTASEVSYIISDSEVTVAFVEEGHPATPAFSSVEVIPTRCPSFRQFADGSSEDEPVSTESAEDAALQLYTSGTTGRPKGAIMSQAALIQNGLTIQLSQRLAHDDVFLSATPLTHAASGTRVFSLAIDGMAHVILERWNPELFLDEVERHGVTTTILVPTMLQDLLDSPAYDSTRLRAMRTIVYGAAPSTRELVERAIQALPCGLVHGYGLTEGCPALTVLTPEENRRFYEDPALRHRLTSIGRPVPGVRIRIVDDDGRPVAPGAPGELLVRSTKTMSGYWHNMEATRQALRDGWLATGDVAKQDDEGYVYLVDRKKDVLISGGLNVYPSEIERVLSSDDSVDDVAVIGVPDERWGEVAIAFVVASGPDPTNRLREICRRELASYKQPRRILRVETLPRNPTGKILRQELRGLVSDGMGAPLTSPFSDD